MYSTDPFAPALRRAHDWLSDIVVAVGTEDPAFAYRLVRAWLHTVRDHLPVVNSAHLSAQLPELFRGLFYEGWKPAGVPKPHDLDSFVAQFAATAEIDPAEVPALAGAVTTALAQLFSPGQLDHVFEVLPERINAVLRGEYPATFPIE
ncbi:DUF2267 domain-containing protein [Nocardia sp. NPDC005366]|uniref:DUF2267 domain-containing protein n=1 Tax=Nocardia sp. NPDC005366 TaxID=3156878 RepID=UPI0033B1391C